MKNNLNPRQQLGKYGELTVAARFLDEGREVYFPAVDDHGIDMMVITQDHIHGDGTQPEHYPFQEIQVKTVATPLQTPFTFSLSKDRARPNYWFVFYVKEIETFWIINSMDIITPGAFSQNISGKNTGKYNVSLTTTSGNISQKNAKYIVKDFSAIP